MAESTLSKSIKKVTVRVCVCTCMSTGVCAKVARSRDKSLSTLLLLKVKTYPNFISMRGWRQWNISWGRKVLEYSLEKGVLEVVDQVS